MRQTLPDRWGEAVGTRCLARAGSWPRLGFATRADGCEHRIVLALDGAANCANVKATAMTRNDPIKFSERFDLIHNDLAHLRGALGGFLRNLENTAPKLSACDSSS